MLKLLLSKLPADFPGIYKGKMPSRALWAHPGLAKALVAARARGVPLVLSDCLRSPLRSLERRRELALKGGPQLAQPPGFSAHNFGLAVDVDVQKLVTAFGSKPSADAALREFGLVCHRLDGAVKAESWHYNFLGLDKENQPLPTEHSSAKAVERVIQKIYGEALRLADPGALVRALNKAGFRSIKDFQAVWGLEVDGIAGPKTRRTLASVTATIEEVSLS